MKEPKEPKPALAQNALRVSGQLQTEVHQSVWKPRSLAQSLRPAITKCLIPNRNNSTHDAATATSLLLHPQRVSLLGPRFLFLSEFIRSHWATCDKRASSAIKTRSHLCNSSAAFNIIRFLTLFALLICSAG
jgi:hypothetical protein